ncbi:TPA: hypothetical protein ACXE50_001867 [Klebsiella aerogenes]
MRAVGHHGSFSRLLGVLALPVSKMAGRLGGGVTEKVRMVWNE